MPIDRANYPEVPDDFPVNITLSAVPGAQMKLVLVEEDGRFYAPGTSPSEVLATFQMCEDLVLQMASHCERKLPAFEGDREATGRAAFQGLLNKRWCSPAQSEWIMRKVFHELNWPLSDGVLTR